MFKVYILHSKTRKRYYIGFTGDDITSRLQKHNSHHRGFTGSAVDWEVVWLEDGLTETEARKREAEIKAWKSRKRMEVLIYGRDPSSVGSEHPASGGRVTGSSPVVPT